MRAALLAAAAASMAFAASARAEPAQQLVGLWLTENSDSTIRIAPCGNAYCGTVVWAKTNGLDLNNPDPSLRKRSIVGMPLTKDLRPSGSGAFSGSIYNPQDGKTYAITMAPKAGRKLEVEGCVLGVLCGSETWSRQIDETASVKPAGRQ